MTSAATLSKPKTSQRYPVPALDKGLGLIELLASQPTGMTFSELACSASRKANEIFRMVGCLKRRGYVALDPISDKLVLTINS